LFAPPLSPHAAPPLTRWPQGRSVGRPRRSCCAGCGSALRAWENLPVVSWLLLRGRCRTCGVRIDPRLIMLELACAAICGLVATMQVRPAVALVVGLTGCGAALATATDLERRIIPDRLTLPLAAAVLPLSLAAELVRSGEASHAMIGALRMVAAPAVGIPLILVLLNLMAGRWSGTLLIGGGDIKLLVSILAAAATLPDGVALFGSVTAIVGGCIAGAGVLTGRLGLKDRLPFAPILLVGLVATIVWSHPLLKGVLGWH
jgi:leader peptidase (prepilin peptidase) / N-methyltransferase